MALFLLWVVFLAAWLWAQEEQFQDNFPPAHAVTGQE